MCQTVFANMFGPYFLDILENVNLQTSCNDSQCFAAHRLVITALGFTGWLNLHRELMNFLSLVCIIICLYFITLKRVYFNFQICSESWSPVPWVSKNTFVFLLCDVRLCVVWNIFSFFLCSRVRASWIYVNNCPTRCNYIQFIYISVNCSTCFGWYLHPSSGAHITVSTASGISVTVTATCR
jgi:hypothetical protein